MSAAQRLLDRLERVLPSRPSQWLAACPVCRSRRGRPLSIRETDDGRVLVHAFCGCETSAVLETVGLALSDLFDKPLDHHLPQIRSRIPARDLLAAVAHEVTVVAILAADLIDRRALGANDWERLSTAAARICKAASHAN